MTERPFISFLTDFGATSSAPAVCRGVMLGIAPDARLVDITHAIRPFAVRDGAFLLARSVPYFPVGVHVGVVDPGVGTPRRPVALRAARGDLFVGPDNGLLVPAAESLGGIVEARTLENPALWLATVSNTFHGRDIFSPVGAWLAAGTPFAQVGPLLDPAALVRFPMPGATLRDGGLDSSILLIDAFGNCRIAGETADLATAAGNLTSGRIFDLVLPARDGRPASRTPIPWVATFCEVSPGAPLLFEDADYAGPALGINQGSAAERFGLTIDDAVRLEPT
ncbi:MAG: SAM-dependent chlorinase/fluorinase [Chloroflexota bacterium]|nr:SAM-dependent chlorinase/fluorinase [Chloroflexota bacterium]